MSMNDREESKSLFEREEEERTAKARAKIPDWTKRSEKVVYPEKMEDWKKHFEFDAKGLDHGSNVEDTLILMEKMESGVSIEELVRIMREDLCWNSHEAIVMRMMLHFSKKGPDFFEAASRGELTDETKKILKDIREENARLERIHKAKPTERRSSEGEEQEL